MVDYHDLMAPQVELPIEAPDLTATELHNDVAIRLFGVLRILFRGTALVLHDIFLRVDETRQVAPDRLIVHGSVPGRRTVYRGPDEPVPDITIEVLSDENHQPFGRRKLEEKRELFGAIGVRVHIELDPTGAASTPPGTRRSPTHLPVPTGRPLRLATHLPASASTHPRSVTLWLPDGREYTDASGEYDRAKTNATSRRLARPPSAGIDPGSV